MTILEGYFRKLYARYGINQSTHVQMAEIAGLFGCSIRNTRNMLNRMRENEWLLWQAKRGRGNSSSLRLLVTPESLFNQNINGLLASQDVGKVLKFIGTEKNLLERIIQYKFGASGEGSETKVRIPYYRNLDVLNPLKPLRRTERHLLRQCLSGLTRYDPVRMEIVPDLAHYWSHDENYTHWEIFLKPTAMFSDGTTVKSHDVKKCLELACSAPWFMSLFRMISEIDVVGDYRIMIKTHAPVKHLDFLLATQPALIFDRHNDVMKCTGPFSIASNEEGFLTLRRNTHYHYARPMLSEIDIFTWAPKHISMSFIPILHDEETHESDTLKERKLEHGCCFLLIDSKGLFAAEGSRKFINKTLQPIEILDNSDLPEEYGSILSLAQGMLPEWNHKCVDFGTLASPYVANRKIVLATYQQPELVKLSNAMAMILKRYNYSVEVLVLQFSDFSTMQNINADLWLTNFMVDNISSHSFLDWLSPDPVFKKLPEQFDRAYQQLQTDLLNVDIEDSKACVETFFSGLTSQRWVIPLFHHWLELKSEKSFSWRDLNTLGWPDFSQLWSN
ncbi:TPA: SgrR family transcriptional regulator [Raoultella planticola]|nr:SgrR family transcriptional regulator [Klebsiella pneumoniae]